VFWFSLNWKNAAIELTSRGDVTLWTRCSEMAGKAYGFLFPVRGAADRRRGRGRGVLGRHRATELAAQIDGGGVDVLAAGAGPQVKGVAVGAALEAVEGVVGKVGGEGAAGGVLGAVDRARATLLGAPGGAGREAQQRQDVGEGDRLLDGGEVDAGAAPL